MQLVFRFILLQSITPFSLLIHCLLCIRSIQQILNNRAQVVDNVRQHDDFYACMTQRYFDVTRNFM